jgi:hypothetical protein
MKGEKNRRDEVKDKKKEGMRKDFFFLENKRVKIRKERFFLCIYIYIYLFIFVFEKG